MGEGMEVPDAPYPRAVRVSSTGAEVRSWQSESKQTELTWIDGDPLVMSALLDQALADGGCAAVICNTVKHAQDTFAALQGHLGDGTELDLFHARFQFDERDRREKRAIERFGKGDANRPERAVLVATQVIEQSLDLDFDLMISELAPVDLLLQRSGRMHRHPRTRPEGLESPRLLLMQPEQNDEGLPQLGNSSFIYGDYLLLKTWLALQRRDTLRVPEDVEDLICEVYEHEPESGNSAIENSLDEAQAAARRRRETLEYQAALRKLPPPDLDETFHALPTDLALEEDNPDLHGAYRALTRWEDQPSIEIVCVETVDGQPHVRRGEEMLPVDLDAAPSEELAEALVRRSVRISGVAARSLLESDPPRSWRRNSLLRHHRATIFDETDRFAGQGFVLRNDPVLGIVTERDSDGEE